VRSINWVEKEKCFNQNQKPLEVTGLVLEKFGLVGGGGLGRGGEAKGEWRVAAGAEWGAWPLADINGFIGGNLKQVTWQ
jgi:hypothetical protein